MIITIARQCGCGAVRVGKLLSDHYGIPFYNRKSLFEMAAQRGLTDQLANFFEERPVDELLFSISTYGEKLSTITEKPLCLLAEMIGQEDCIIIGRCGNYIFRKRKDLVSVFLNGLKTERIINIEREEKLTNAEAKEFVESMDDQRAAYHLYYTGLTWGNAPDYDICLNSLRLGAENTAQIIEQYVEGVL